MNRLLIVEDEVVLARTLLTFLQRQGFEGTYVTNAADAKSAFIRETPQLAIVDYKLGDDDGLELLLWMRETNPECHAVMMTGHGDVELAVNAMKLGARDFLVKPVPMKVIADMACHLLLDQKENIETNGLDRLIGRSSATVNLRKSVKKLAAFLIANAPPGIVIMGAAGTGKSLVARVLHEISPRTNNPFMVFDCTLQSGERNNLLQASFQQARSGTLLLRHVEALSQALQDELIHLLHEQSDNSTRPWLVSTTTSNQLNDPRLNLFRNDLLYQLQVGWIEVPTLADRTSDIFPIAERLAQKIALKYDKSPLAFTADARIKLLEYPWPGNISELVNCIERAVFDATQGVIDAPDLRMVGSIENAVPKLDQVEEQVLDQALKVSGGNVSKAARLLGISRDKMRYRMQKIGLTRR